MVQMNIAEAKAKLSELVARAEAGEEVVIARDGVPVVALAVVAKVGARRPGFLLENVDLEGWNPDHALDEDDPRDWGLEDEELLPRSIG